MILIVIFHRYGEVVIEKLLPLYQWEIATLEDQYQIIQFGLDNEADDRVVRLTVKLAKPVFLGGKFFYPDTQGSANASTIIGHVWETGIVFLGMILAWPAKSSSRYLIRFLIAIPLIVGLTMLDIPFTLLAALWDLIVQHLAPETLSPLILWNHFLEGGGRLALGLFGGFLCIRLANLFVKQNP